MKKLSVKLGTLALVAAILTLAIPMASADSPNDAGHRMMVKEALGNSDYEAFLAAIPENCPMAEKITEENFQKMVEAHNYMKAGDFESARKIMDELGIERPFKKRMKNKFKEKWQNLTEEQKEILKGARDLIKEGEFEAAKELLEEAGIEKPMKAGPGPGSGIKGSLKNHFQNREA